MENRWRERFTDLPLAFKSILGFWALYASSVIARLLLAGQAAGIADPARLLIIGAGIAVTCGIYLVLRLASRCSLARRGLLAALTCVPAAFLLSAAHFAALYASPHLELVEQSRDGTILRRSPAGELSVQRPGDRVPLVVGQLPPMQEVLRAQAPRFIIDGAVTWYFFFVAWAAFYVAMSGAEQLRRAERRAADMERAAQSAQLRALRYQVNPHFLFNTLNSLSSLIMSKSSDEAETMIINLSNFFRSSLTIDPTEDISLREEIALQLLYLDIEKVRFPHRLNVSIDIPEDLLELRVPALILQPLVENAIRHGVARTREPMSLLVSAARANDRAEIVVENSPVSACGNQASQGTGVGLANVCERLATRYAASATCTYGLTEVGGFRVSIVLPIAEGAKYEPA